MKKILLVSFCILFVVLKSSFAEVLIIEFDKKVTSSDRRTLPGEISKFTKYKSEYFDYLYLYKTKKNLTKKELKNLKRKPFIKSIEQQSVISSFSIEPARMTRYGSKDPLYNYQWGLEYQGQKVFNEVNDLEDILLRGEDKSDVEITNLDILDKKFKREVLLAIIDTGVDYNHPDLKDNIFKNLIECENGEIPFDAKESKDDNEYPGDCKGWNFTGKKELGTNRPEDFVGHGTHLAGIASSVRNNNIGLSGISNHIKILPLKVLSNTGEDSQAIGTSDRLSRAILYAIQMKADVINLSLGWPLSFDKKHLRKAVLEAVQKGVTVVAAAGNNDHSEPIMPCAYEGVICVGASDPNMNISDFSNYGAHVDVLAPGNNILSTFPTANTPLFFDLNGYEIKSGTSQSAPYVSALVATLKGIFPNLSENELKARVFNNGSGGYVKNNKFSSGGLINFSKSLGAVGKVLKPRLKGFSRVKVNIALRTFQFKIDFSDYDTGVADALIQVLPPKGVSLEKQSFNLKKSLRSILVKGSFDDLDMNLLQKFKLLLSYDDLSSEFHFEKRFYVDLEDLRNIKKFAIVGANPKSLTKLTTINQMHHRYSFPYYYTETKQKSGVVLSLFTKSKNVIRNIGTTLLKNAKSILSIHRVDADLDGTADILVRSLIEIDADKPEEDKRTTIMYSYLTEKLRPLFFQRVLENNKEKMISHSHMNLNFEGVILQDLDDFSFGRVKFSDYGEILVPVYTTYAEQPRGDINPNPFSRLRRRIFSSKIFFYLPVISNNEVQLETRTLNNHGFIDTLKKKIGFRPFEQVFIIKSFTQSFEQIKKGFITLLLSHESERKLPRNYILTISDIDKRLWEIEEMKGEGLNLSSFIAKRGHDLRASSQLKHDADLEIVGYEQSSRLIWDEFFINKRRIDYVSVEQRDIFDPLEFPIKTYRDHNKVYRFFLTPSRIFLEIENEQRKVNLSFPVHVSSFLPGLLFREQHFPISYIHEGKAKPALYVDSTQISSRNIYLITTDDEKIYAPIKFNLNIPEHCKALNPVIIDEYKYEYSVQCFNRNGTSDIHYIPLE